MRVAPRRNDSEAARPLYRLLSIADYTAHDTAVNTVVSN
jgi:hypothetical protein